MKVHTHTTSLPVFSNAVITIGTFDGVHKGHQQILHQLKAEAARVNGETVIITFDPHPRKVVTDDRNRIMLLNTLEEKKQLLEKRGINHLVVVPFTGAFAQQSAQEYVRDFLVAQFHPHTIIIGYDHKFGHNRQGDYHLLETLAPELGFTVREIPQHVLQNIAISSTRIRESLLRGEAAAASELLGYSYFFSGTVVEGNKLGRTLGYPTANLQLEEADKLVPGNGVYAVHASVDNGQPLGGMMNIGVRPTVDGTKRVIEVNIFGFDADIYGRSLTVTLLRQLREEVKFNGLDALKAQLAKDKEAAMAIIG